ncbi:MAG TPA: hypothetical protein VKV20_15470 [Ktedonobacteraceae bacterium]|jgi:alkylhydroperoxidase family enzyme|nr:hypothetical protein [Ktedonobacteraceae bacterium]
MNNSHAEYAQQLKDAVLQSPGDTSTQMRQSVAAYAAHLSGRPAGSSGDIPADLAAYLKKVALHAYKTTGEDIAALREAGYSEDAIFEITLSAALGAGLARLEGGQAALKGNQE